MGDKKNWFFNYECYVYFYGIKDMVKVCNFLNGDIQSVSKFLETLKKCVIYEKIVSLEYS